MNLLRSAGTNSRSLHLDRLPSLLASASLAAIRIPSSVSASRSSLFLLMASRARKALSSLPFWVSHRGDSGTKSKPMPMARVMTMLKATGNRHEKVLS